MKRLDRVLFDLRADMARNPGATNDMGLVGLLAEITSESDANLRAAGEFFGFDIEALENSAATMQYDGGLPRAAANRMALANELRRVMPGISDTLCRWFAQNSAAVMTYGRQNGLRQEEIAERVREYFSRESVGAGHNGGVGDTVCRAGEAV